MSLSPVFGSAEDAGAPRSVHDDGASQEEILDLIVAATLAHDDPLDDEAADGDYWDPDDFRDPRGDGPDAGRAPADGADAPQASAEGSPFPGWGFSAGGALDELLPGPVLAGLADTAHVGALRRVNDNELTGMIQAWRRLTSWATARELAAIAELARRRPEDEKYTPGSQMKARLRAAGLGDGDSARGNGLGDKADAAGENDSPAAPANGEASGTGGEPPRATGAEPPRATGASEPGAKPPRAGEPGRSADKAPGPDTGFPEFISPFASDELVAALTLTARAAEAHMELATGLATRLRLTAAALEAGMIDLDRARLIADATRILSDEHAAAVEKLILSGAEQQTTGQLRAALARAILEADPDAVRRRREEAQRDARVTRWREDTGTAALCGRDLPSAEVLAADQRISERARELRAAGVEGTMDQLRAHAYLDFLLGRSAVPEDGVESGQRCGPDSSRGRGDGVGPESSQGPGGGGSDRRAASPAAGGGSTSGYRGAAPGHANGSAAGSGTTGGLPNGLAARINVTVPLSALLGLSDLPAEVASFGPVDAYLARDLVRAAGTHPATRWCVTVVGEDGQAVGHGCARGRHTAPSPPPPDSRDGPGPPQEPQHPALGGQARDFMERLGIRVTPLAVGTCDHRNEESGYKPSRRLRHLTGARTATCTAPGCRRAAAQCDLDHTLAYDAGGRTCECNLGPLCRRHHRCKQAQGWALEQSSPGHMIWTAPSGRRYTTMPTRYYV